MSPPHNDPAVVPQWSWEVDTEPQEGDLVRVDSPLDIRHAVPVAHPTISAGAYTTTEGHGPQTRPVMVVEDATIPQTIGRPKRQSKGSESGGGVRFFVVNHPDKLRDKSEMRKNRQHVMQDYLEKERMKPSSNDLRVNGAGQGRKRKRTEARESQTSTNASAPAAIFRQDLARVTPAPSDHSTAASEAHLEIDDAAAASLATATDNERRRADLLRSLTRQGISNGLEDKAPLVPGISGRFRNYGYLGTKLEEVPFPLDRRGGSINPFNTWPSFSDPSVNVNQLKWSCSCRFGSKGMALNWVPTLLKARHAFLSTICISSAHDDIMRRSSLPPAQRPQLESIEVASIRKEVTSMINQSMSDPQMQTADATIVAVLQLLNAEIIGCDDKLMEVHQSGLHAMIRQRGGLNALGVSGELASITMCTMYIIAALRETLPHADFVRYAQKQDTRLPKDLRALPESPVYCRPTGYHALTKAVSEDSAIFKLLEAGRLLTGLFIERHAHRARSSSSCPARTGRLVGRKDHLQTVANEILAYQPADELAFRTSSERNTYEAIRLASRLYAHALANCIPFSEAAAQLAATPATHAHTQTSRTTPAAKPPAIHIRIRNALRRTDTTDCWGHMAGVLFWIALVAGAGASPSATMRKSVFAGAEEDEARKWLAAIVVRCSIVMGFEFAGSIMETLKRLVGIQEVLRGGGGGGEAGSGYGYEREKEEADRRPAISTTRIHGQADLPPPAQQVQKGFADFARDFMGSLSR